jgi:hypothetical protein
VKAAAAHIATATGRKPTVKLWGLFSHRNEEVKEWFLTEEPSTFFSWANLAYTFTDWEHPLANYNYVFIEI